MFRSSWSQPTLHVLLRLPMPIGFIYGAKDDIMPVHQGLVVSESTASSLPVCLVREAGHSPQGTHPEQFVAAFLYAYNAAAIISPEAAAEIHKRLPDTALMQYFSTYSVADTEAMLSEQYAVLRSVLRGSETVAGTTFEVLDGRVTAAAQANLVVLLGSETVAGTALEVLDGRATAAAQATWCRCGSDNSGHQEP
eukprot:gene28834-32022_t